MQEASKFPRPIKKRNAFDTSTDDHDLDEKADSTNTPGGLKVTLERSESVHAWRSTDRSPSSEDRSDARDGGVSIDAKDARDLPPLPQTPGDSLNADAVAEPTTYGFRSADASDTTANEADSSDYTHVTRASDVPSVSQFLKLPLLALVTLGAVLVATWSFTTLENTKAQLATANEAKASVDRALAEAQGRLSAAEKAVADVKAALSAVPAATETAAPAAAPAVPAQQ